MTELQAGQGAQTLVPPRIDARPQRYRDVLIALIAFALLALLPMLFGMQIVMLVTRMATGAEFPGVLWFLSSITATLLWTPITYVLLTPQFQPEDKDVHRPI